MEKLSPICRPVMLREIASAFQVPYGRLNRLVVRHRIAPACRIGKMRVYGPKQIRRIYALVAPVATA